MGQKITRRRFVLAVLAFALAQSSMSVNVGPVHRQQYAAAAGNAPCPTGTMNYVPGGTLNAPTNTYYQPAAGTLSAGATSVNLGTMDTGGGGASTAVAAGDELLIMQMQDGGNGSFNSTNTSSYGDGSGSGSGYTSVGNAGLYEYAYVSSLNGSTATIQGGGTSGGLINSYYENTSNNQRYQIVRVPEYTTATLSNNFTAAYWDGKTGGVAALDISSTLNLGGASIYATGDGFRGGGLSQSSTSPSTVLNSDYADSATMNGTTTAPAFGSKGEGILGTPDYVFYYASFTTPSSPASPTVTHGSANGYPGGDQGMGAPGNAGGGGDDDDPAANDQNTGGGGGANGGAGGKGGYPWTPKYSGNTSLYSQFGIHTAPGTGYSSFNNADIGGRGGAALTASIGRAFMGGGGGAGANNNGSNNNTFSADGSSGGTGGGVVLLRIADTSGSAATIYANGTTGLAPDNDGGGGGGAGGTVIITSPNAFSGITVYANGAAGTTAAAADSYPQTQHGPGGGGGGGIVLSSSSVSASVTGGSNGTTTGGYAYGATSGSAGYSSSVISPSSVPGIGSGADCFSSGTQGSATLYNGPYDSGEATYNGADYTGSYDGVQSATNNNDFTAREIPLPTPSPLPQNTGTSATTPTGNTFTLSSAPSLNVENSLYYVNSGGGYKTITLTGAAPILPAQWSVQICPDGAQTGGTAGTPNCSYAGTGSCKSTGDRNKWETVGTSGSTSSTVYCYHGTTAQALPYWAVYTGPTGTYTAFSRYDGWIDAQDNQTTPASNRTHNELYAGFVPIAKNTSVVTNGCPSGVNPASGVCPSGVIEYSVQYANIVVGGGVGTEGQVAAAFPETQAGSLVISDDGSGGLNGTNWATYTNGLVNALAAGTTGSSCGVYSGGVWGTCGDTTPGTTCTYDSGHPSGVNATSFSCTIGGSSFQLYPSGFTGQTSSGTLRFAVQAK